MWTLKWESLIKFGFYTGQRLGDLKGLTWANIDLESNVLRFRIRKTRRDAIIPICEPLLDHILTLEGSKDDPKAPLHPRSAKTRVSTLSKTIRRATDRCRFAPKTPTGRSRARRPASTKRDFVPLSAP